MARHLVVWSQAEFPAHRPHKNKIETLLILLAGVFADHTGYKYDPDTLPNTPNGRFIGMALERSLHSLTPPKYRRLPWAIDGSVIRNALRFARNRLSAASRGPALSD